MLPEADISDLQFTSGARIVVTGQPTIVAIHTYIRQRAPRRPRNAKTVVTVPGYAAAMKKLIPAAPVFLVGVTKHQMEEVCNAGVACTWVRPHEGQPGNGMHILPWLVIPVLVLPKDYDRPKHLRLASPPEAYMDRSESDNSLGFRRALGGVSSSVVSTGDGRKDWAMRWLGMFADLGREVAISIVAYLAIECDWGAAEQQHNPGFLTVLPSSKTPSFRVKGNPLYFESFKSDDAFVKAYVNKLKSHPETWDLLVAQPTSDHWYNTLAWYSSDKEIRSAHAYYLQNRSRINQLLQ